MTDTVHQHPFAHVKGHPSLAEIEVTSACNARCVFCPRHLFEKPTRMTDAIFDRVLARLVEAEMTHVKFVGIGEPTLHSKLLVMLRRVRESGMSPMLNTNGSLLHRWDLDQILGLCDEVIVSVHSLERETHRTIFGADLYEQSMRNLDSLIAANQRHQRTLTLYVVLTTLNAGDLAAFERFGSAVRLRVSGCTNRALEGFADELIDLEINARQNHYESVTEESPMCGYAEAAVVIDSLGRYLLCTNDVERNTGIGDVFGLSIAEAFQLVRDGLGAGGFLSLCQRCENFGPYREQLAARRAEPGGSATRQKLRLEVL